MAELVYDKDETDRELANDAAWEGSFPNAAVDKKRMNRTWANGKRSFYNNWEMHERNVKGWIPDPTVDEARLMPERIYEIPYRGDDRPTRVLLRPPTEPNAHVGEINNTWPTPAAERAARNRRYVDDEIMRHDSAFYPYNAEGHRQYMRKYHAPAKRRALTKDSGKRAVAKIVKSTGQRGYAPKISKLVDEYL